MVQTADISPWCEWCSECTERSEFDPFMSRDQWHCCAHYRLVLQQLTQTAGQVEQILLCCGVNKRLNK